MTDGTTGPRLTGRLIAVGVTGSIAAYRAVDLVRRLRDEGADVVVLMTASAQRFVGPLTFAALSSHPVETDPLALLPDERIGHIVVADTADAFVIAPATAHWLGAMANGLAGDAVTAAVLATAAPVVVAPAMDGDMWTHPATQANVARLRDGFGYAIVEPDSGPLASGQSGVGRLADVPRIVDAVVTAIGRRPVRQPDPSRRPPAAARSGLDLDGRHVVITAGGTREPIDPVRYIGNRSTGKMGVALAEAALDRGADVTLIVGHTEVELPARATVVRAESTGAMRAALMTALSLEGGRAGFDALIMAAAVADFTPTRAADTKLVRGGALTLELMPTPDLLAHVGRLAHGVDSNGEVTRRPLEPRPILVGFAAETGSLDRAPEKLRRKHVDLLVANDVVEPGSGFGSETNRVTILDADGSAEALPLLPKREVADRILDRVVQRLDARDRAAHTPAMQPEPTR